MTPEQQRILIAEACGYVPMYIPGNFKEQVWHIPGGSFDKLTDCRILQTLPDYLNDLNAMHEAEKALTGEKQCRKYYDTLAVIVMKARENCVPIKSEHFYSSATAAQRAEAFLRTIGKWVDTDPATLLAQSTPDQRHEAFEKTISPTE